MKTELRHHLPPLIITFVFVSAVWLFHHSPPTNVLLLCVGLSIGAFFLDIDHLIYWFYTHPELEESQLAALAWKRGDFRSIFKLLSATRQNHNSLIFHHFVFQIILALISVFAFTSTSSILGRSILLSLNLHLLVDEFIDYRSNPAHLQDWLFSRFPKQLPTTYLLPYLTFFFTLFIIFSLLLAI